MENKNLFWERSNILPVVFIILSVILFVLVLLGVKLPFIEDFQGGLIALSALGILMGVTSYKSTEALNEDGITNGFVIVSTIISVLAIIVVGAALLGISLPLISTDRDSFIALGVLMLGGWITTMSHHLVNKNDLYLNA